MPMSRRFYNNLASRLSDIEPRPENYRLDGPSAYEAAVDSWSLAVITTARAIKEEAPSFDMGRFTLAAGIDPARAAALS